MSGAAYVSRVFAHCSACFGLLHSGLFAAMNSRAQSANVFAAARWAANALGLLAPQDRVDALVGQFARLPGLLSGLRQRHVGVAAEAHIPALAVDGDAQNPCARATRGDLEVQPSHAADRLSPGLLSRDTTTADSSCAFRGSSVCLPTTYLTIVRDRNGAA